MTSQLNLPQQNIQSFQFKTNQVRTEIINGGLWTCLVDVCKVLGIKQPTRVVPRLNEHGVNQIHVIDAKGRKQKAFFINESNLYKVIFRSDKPEARAFEDWVTGEVLPSIRKTGGYQAATQPQLDAPSTKDDRRPISSLIGVWVGTAPITYKEAWQMIHARFKISSVDELMASQVPKVLDWIQERIDHACATPARDFDVIMEQLRDSRDATRKDVKQACNEWEAAGGYGMLGGADLLYNLRHLYQHAVNLALAAPLALDALNRMEADLYRNATVRLKMQKLIG